MKCWTRISLASLLLGIFLLSVLLPDMVPFVRAQPSSSIGTLIPSTYPLLFGSSGNVEIDIPKPGIAVRIEIPREFLQGVVSGDNDTHFITSNIRNDYYYYNLVDESRHWTYDWRGNTTDGACFKPTFSYYDADAPYCLEIWNYLTSPINSTGSNILKQPAPGIDYCQPPNLDKFVFACFSTSPNRYNSNAKFVLLHNLASPTLAGLYNFTLFVANRTNTLGYPDFVHAYNTTLFVPVSMAYNAGFIAGNVCDGGSTTLLCAGPIRGKGIVYAKSTSGQIVARAYVNQTLCNQVSGSGCGLFKLTGLAPGSYQVEGSAGVDHGVAYSLTPYGCGLGLGVGGVGCPNPQTVVVSANSGRSITLPLRRAPLVCGSINYVNQFNSPVPSLTGQPYLLAAGFGFGNPNFELNVTVEGTDPFGHVFRFESVSTGTSIDSFNLTTGVGVKYVGTDPYGTEFAGLPAPEDVAGGTYSLNVNVWVSGYLQVTPTSYAPLTVTANVFESPGSVLPTCPSPPGTSLSPNPVVVLMGGVITGTLQFCNSLPSLLAQPAAQTCSTLESPQAAEMSLPISPFTGALFGGNVIIQAYDASGILRGVTIINGTAADGTTSYPSSICTSFDLDGCNSLRFYVTGFSEYYNHTLSGTWEEHDYGLPPGTYTLQVYVRGYELTSTNSVSIGDGGFSNVTAAMTRGGAFQVSVGSYDDRFGTGNSTRVIQANLPWRFLNSSIPVRARVYFYASNGATVGYVEAIMVTNLPNEIGVISFTNYTFKVIFAGQNWSLREIWFYGFVPTYVTNDTYTILAYTLGYVGQFPGGISLPNQLVGFGQALIALFIANEVDVTVPIFANPQIFTKTAEYDHAIGQVFSGPLFGAEMANLTAGIPTLQFNIFGFGAMELSNATECTTKDHDEVGRILSLCGQGHFFYVSPGGTRFFDYGLDVGTYSAALNQPQLGSTSPPQFGFLYHFMQVLALPVVSFTDLFLEQGVFLQVIQMASLMQGPGSVVQGFCNGSCLPNPPSQVVPLSWAQVQATSANYTVAAPTSDGLYDGVGALFLPAGLYNVTFTDTNQYQSQTYNNFYVQWGGSYSLTPQPPLCPTGTTCP
jgi:hypothetical protein